MAHGLGLHDAFPWPDLYAYLDWLLEGTGMRFEEFKEKDLLLGDMRYRKHEEGGFRTPTGKFEFYSTVVEHEGVRPFRSTSNLPFRLSRRRTLRRNIHFILMTGSKGRITSIRRCTRSSPCESATRPCASDTSCHRDLPRHIGPRLGVGRVALRNVKLRARLFDGIAPDVVNAEHAWWYPEASPPDYRWKESSVNLLFGDEHFDPDTGAEPLKCYLCKITPVT